MHENVPENPRLQTIGGILISPPPEQCGQRGTLYDM